MSYFDSQINKLLYSTSRVRASLEWFVKPDNLTVPGDQKLSSSSSIGGMMVGEKLHFSDSKEFEIIGIALAGAVTVVMADRSFSLLSVLVGLIIVLILASENAKEVGVRIYSALFALGLVIILGFWMDMILLYVTQEFRWLSNTVASTAHFLDRIGFLPNRSDEIGEPNRFEPGPMWMNGYSLIFHILIIAIWYTLASLIFWRNTGGNGWRCFVSWWKGPSSGGGAPA